MDLRSFTRDKTLSAASAPSGREQYFFQILREFIGRKNSFLFCGILTKVSHFLA